MKRIVLALLACMFLVSLIGCGDSTPTRPSTGSQDISSASDSSSTSSPDADDVSNLDILELYNPSLGVTLQLGMEKTVVDQKLGTPVPDKDNYEYTDTGLHATYADGKLSSMIIGHPNDQWITKNGVTIGTTTDELQQLLGQPDSIYGDGTVWNYDNGSKFTTFLIDKDLVLSISIADADLFT